MKHSFNRGKYALHVFKQFYEYNHKRTKLSTLPQICEIEATINCNLRCRFCARETFQKYRHYGVMPLEKFRFIVETYRDQLITPSLSLDGEATLHPELPEMVRLVKANGAHSVSITTNATLLNEGLFMKLVDAGLDGIEVSFEGVDKETYEYIRVGANFDATKHNILRMCELKTKEHLPVDISINIVDSKLTHDKLPEFLEYWTNIEGLSRVDVTKIIDWVGALDPQIFKEFLLPETYNHPFSKFAVCPMAWFTVGINCNGGVVPCCRWFYEPMGNIFENSLEEIWNGEKYVAFRKLMLTEGRHAHPYCVGCWDGTIRRDSPYFHLPNRLFPFTKQFARNVKTFMRWSNPKEYAPNRLYSRDVEAEKGNYTVMSKKKEN
jgi:MoaA/NifB/PqqE/SkfB family radical SAM enzyme